MDATELGKLCEKHADTFIVVIRNPDGSVDRIGEATVEPIIFFDDCRIEARKGKKLRDLDGVDRVLTCLVLNREPE